jgi:PTS system nitrogen regulatory IIA component
MGWKGFPGRSVLSLSLLLSYIIFLYQIFTTNIFRAVDGMDTFDKWLTIEELATYLKLSRTKLYGMAQRCEIPASKIGIQWRFDREEIDQWMKSHSTGKGGSKA